MVDVSYHQDAAPHLVGRVPESGGPRAALVHGQGEAWAEAEGKLWVGVVAEPGEALAQGALEEGLEGPQLNKRCQPLWLGLLG
eukprot:10791183-Lingulodinium_polyedra.AAC.1